MMSDDIAGDDFRKFGEKDAERLSGLNAVENGWMRACRHSKTEDIQNELGWGKKLSDAMLAFNNDRLARNGGSLWVAEQARPLGLFDSLTVVESSFIDAVLEEAIPKLGSCLLYTSPSPRDRQRSRMPSSA